MRITTIIGARPQFVKAAIVSKCLAQFDNLHEDIIHTGQHYDDTMSQIFFKEMGIPTPKYNLHIGSGLHGYMTGEMLKAIELKLLDIKPDLVMVYGDTNSTLAGAIAAVKLHIPIAHVEAGERSFNRKMPEEVNRILTDHSSSLLFCCSEKAEKHLRQEGIQQGIKIVGDVMLDAFLYNVKNAKMPNIKIPKNFALATIHRSENTEIPEHFAKIIDQFGKLNEEIVLPLHPRTSKFITNNKINIPKSVIITPPLSYFELLGLLKECNYVLTDSGGLQKEAYYAEKKCITLRSETEWSELISIGAVKLVSRNFDNIVDLGDWAKKNETLPKFIYGKGDAGNKIANNIHNWS